MRKLLSFVLAVCMLLALAACSTDTHKPPTPGTESQVESAGGTPAQNDPDKGPESGTGAGQTDQPAQDPTEDPAEEPTRTDITYEQIIEDMATKSHSSPPSEREGMWKFYIHYCEDGIGDAQVYVDTDSISGELVFPSFYKDNAVTDVDFMVGDMSAVTNIEFPDFMLTLSGRKAVESSQWYKNLPDGPVYIGKALYGYKGKMPPDYDLVVEDGTKVILGQAFEDCTRLRSAVLPDSVVYIGSNAFSGCRSLVKLDIGQSVMYLGYNVISSCQALTSVFVPDTLINIFEDSLQGADIYFPYSEKEFQTAIPDFYYGKLKIHFDCSRENYWENIADEVPDTMMGLAYLANLGVGSIVELGTYEQDGDTSNGPEPIEWYVYDKQDGRALLVSRYILDGAPYFTPKTSFVPDNGPVVNDRGLDIREVSRYRVELIVTWEKSDLRAWLNDTFYNTAFSQEDKESVLTTVVSTPNYRGYTNGCPDTEDNVFVLTYEELDSQAAMVYYMRDSKYTAYAKGKVDDTIGLDLFWLRSNTAHEVDNKSVDVQFYSSDTSRAYNAGEDPWNNMDSNVGVRPAIWVAIPGAEIAQPPEEPETPEQPDTPDTPETPEEPETPDTPETPVMGNAVINSSFEDGDAGYTLRSWAGDGINNIHAADSRTGEWNLHFWSANAISGAMATQTVTLEPGNYVFSLYGQGGDQGENKLFIFVDVDGQRLTADFELTTYLDWKNPTLAFTVTERTQVTVGVSVTAGAGAWGTFDDWSLLPAD